MIVSVRKLKKAQEKKKQQELEKPRANPYVWDRVDMEDGRIALIFPIHISKDRLRILDRICDVTNNPAPTYLKQALYEKIDSDLHSAQTVGQAFCESLLEEWEINNDTNDHRVFQNSTQK